MDTLSLISLPPSLSLFLSLSLLFGAGGVGGVAINKWSK